MQDIGNSGGWQAMASGLVELPRVGRVVQTGEASQPYVLVAPDGLVVDAAACWLRDLVLNDQSPRTVRAYCYAGLTWFRVLWHLDVGWDRATEDETAALMGWLRTAQNPQRRRGVAGVPAGSVNVRTGKPALGEGYSRSTINLTLAAVHSLYAYQAAHGAGPVVNPVPASASRRRALAHRSPIESARPYRRARYRQKPAAVLPRSIPDLDYADLFGALVCVRDRALIACFVASGARASEMLGALVGDVDWAGQRMSVVSKGSRARRVVPLSPDAMTLLGAYMDEDGLPALPGPLWRTRRGAARALNYPAARRIIQRANNRLQTNWSLHDLRHTAAARMVASGLLTLPEIQVILGHSDLRTTGKYTMPRIDELCDKLQEYYSNPPPSPSRPAVQYNEADMATVFGRPITETAADGGRG